MAKKNLTILEITQTHIKLAEFKEEPKKRILTKFIIENISSSKDEDISKALSGLIKINNIKPTNLITVIPRNQITFRNVKLPSQASTEIKKMIEFQASQELPYQKEDLIIDYLIVGKDSSGFSRVLLAIVHRDVVNRYLKIVESLKLKPNSFILSSQGISKWFKVYQEQAEQAQQKIAILMDIDTNTTDLCFFSGNQLLFSRSISFGIRDLKDKNPDNLLKQIHLTIAAYKKEKLADDVSKIILMPYSDNIQDLAKVLENKFLVPTEVIDPQIIISKENKVSLPIQVAKSEVSSSVIFGIAASEKGGFIDLLPQEVHRKQKIQIRNKELISLGVILVLAIISIVLTMFIKIHKKEQYIKTLKSSLIRIDSEARETVQMIKKLDLIKQRQNPKFSTIDIIYELYNLLPENMSLSILELDEQGYLFLEGVALVMSDVFSFQGRLDKTIYFSNVKVKNTSSRRTRKGELIDFNIVCQLTQRR